MRFAFPPYADYPGKARPANTQEAPMPIPFLFLPPQGDKTREWARRFAEANPGLEVMAPETMEGAEQAIAMAEGAYGTIPRNPPARPGKFRGWQPPTATP